ncbi:DNA topoisomerase [Halomonas sp. GXIMD04776]|uniref:DNA topoisomerase n=1 Tax=Halomonas sp. GXIMD04776 TaxID=3415605 RepID=UPI003C960AB4
MTSRALILCEKHSDQADKIAPALGLTRNGSSYTGTWNGVSLTLVWAAGHLLAPVEPAVVSPEANWRDPRSLLPLPTAFPQTPTDRGKKYLGNLKKALSQASEVWLATDPDREGEAIGYEVLQHAKYRGTVKRMWLTGSMEASDVQAAAKRLREGGETISYWRAQQARANADGFWQYLVRAYTASARIGLMGKDLGKGKGKAGVVSAGRVQSATLGLVVERDRTIEGFVPVDHYQAKITLGGGELSYAPVDPPAGASGIKLQDDGKPLFLDRDAMEAFTQRLEGADTADILAADTKQTAKHPPLPYSLTALQRDMSKQHGMTATQTLKAADAMRSDGYLTYPRTEHGELPASLYNRDDLLAILGGAAKADDGLMAPARLAGRRHCLEGADVPRPRCFTDKPMNHHGIIPTHNTPDLSARSDAERKVYLACAQQFIQALLPPATVESLKVSASVDVEDVLERQPALFAGTFKRVVDPGWMTAFQAPKAQKDLPPLVSGASLPIEAVRLHEARTEPPKHFTLDTLLSAMLNAGRQVEGEDAAALKKAEGIGTPATRDTVIQTLFDREYIATQRKGKQQLIVSTPRGRAFIDNTPRMLSDVRVTAAWERELDAIQNASSDAEAKRLRDTFITQQRDFITTRINEVIETMDNAPEAVREATNAPTENMIAAARKIAASRDLELPEGIEHSFDTCRAFLDEVMQQTPPPTDKMKALAMRLADENGVTLNGELTSFRECKAFIDKHLQNGEPTPKMLAAAEAAAKRYGVKIPEAARTCIKECRLFLSEHPR